MLLACEIIIPTVNLCYIHCWQRQNQSLSTTLLPPLKQNSLKPPSTWEVLVLCPLLLLQHLNPSFKCFFWFSLPGFPPCSPSPPTCAFFSFHCRQSALLSSWVLKEGYWHYGHLVALHRIATAHFFPHCSHLQLPQNQTKSLSLSPLCMCLLPPRHSTLRHSTFV